MLPGILLPSPFVFFIYKVVKDLVTIFPVLRDWIKEFLDGNCGMVATNIGHNMLTEQVSFVITQSNFLEYKFRFLI